MSTTTPTNFSSAHLDLVHSFFKYGRQLSELLLITKAESKESLQENTKREIEEEIQQIIDGRSDKIEFPETFPGEKIFPKAIKKIKTILERVIALDDEHGKAADMLQEVKEVLSKLEEEEKENKKQQESKSSSPSSLPSTNGGAGDNLTPFPWNDHKRSELFDHKNAYVNKLNDEEKKCLSFCCGLLPQDGKASWVEVSKRELIHWWTGMDFIKEPLEGDQCLDKLVAEEFLIKKSSSYASKRNSRLLSSSRTNSYVIHSNILSSLKEVPLNMSRVKENGSHRPLYMVLGGEETKDNKKIVAINRRMFNLNDADFFDKYFRINQPDDKVKDIQILHLGTWPYDPERYVVVEDIEALNSCLSKTSKVTSLSLRGILGIIQLPKSIYNIKTLKVLDLKSCTNLETIPTDIYLLTKLTHLDFSECYLLDHIPKGIEQLIQLRVLKGFIIADNPGKSKDQSSSFDDLSKLINLVKLDIYDRVSNFPTHQNLKTLSNMEKLKKLKVTWVLKTKIDNNNDPSKEGHEKDRPNDEPLDDTLPLMPAALEKLDLNAATEINALKLLDSINYKSGNCPKKLYITGGGVWKLDPYKYRFLNVQTLRLRHLPDMHMKWLDCQRVFPELSHLEVCNCPNLIFFPCDDNGIWEKSEQS